MKRKERDVALWLQAATLVLCAALLAAAIRQDRRIDNLRRQLDSRDAAVGDRIDNIADRVSAQIQNAARLVETYELTPAGIDVARRAVSANFTASLRTYRADTAVTLLASLGGRTISTPLAMTSPGAFSGHLSLPLPEEKGGEDAQLVLALSVDTAGTIVRERLDGVDVFSLLSLLEADAIGLDGLHYSVVSVPKPALGKVEVSPEMRFGVRRAGDVSVSVEGAAFRLYCNGRLLKEQPARVDEDILAFAGTYQYGPGEWDNAVLYAPGDEFRLTFVCQDEYGLSYEFTLQYDAVNEYGGRLSRELDYEPLVMWK